MAETQIDVELEPTPSEIDARIAINAAPLDAELATPVQPSVEIAPTATTINAEIAASAAIMAEIALPTTVLDMPVVVAPTQLEVEIGGLSAFDLAAVEFAASKNRTDVIKLAAMNSQSFIDLGSVAPAFVECPTGLIMHPRFVDSGYIEVTFSCSHVGANETFSMRVLIGPRGGPFVTIGPITTPAIASNAAASQFDVAMRIKNHGPTQAQWVLWFAYSQGAGPVEAPPIMRTQRAVALNFDNVSNGDDGDVEIRVECSVSAVTNFLVRNFLIQQYGPRAGVWC